MGAGHGANACRQRAAGRQAFGREHITNCTAIMKSAFARLLPVATLWRQITGWQGEGCADLVRAARAGFGLQKRDDLAGTLIPEAVHRP